VRAKLQIFTILLLGTGSAAFGLASSAVSPLPAGTAIPVTFSHAIDVRKAKAGDRIEAKTLQVVLDGPKNSVAKGSTLLGHVVDATYIGKDQASILTIQFDTIIDNGKSSRLCVSMRAMVNPVDAYRATMEATSLDTSASTGTTLVGGDHIRPGGKQVYTTDDDNVGISNRFGIFSRLEPAEPHNNSVPTACGGISTLQSVAIFSSRACGVYGFPDMRLSLTGETSPRGQIEFKVRRYAVKIPTGTAALLQVIQCGGNE